MIVSIQLKLNFNMSIQGKYSCFLFYELAAFFNCLNKLFVKENPYGRFHDKSYIFDVQLCITYK